MFEKWLGTASTRARRRASRLLRSARRVPWLGQGLRVADLLFDCRVVRRHLSDAHDAALPRVEQALMRIHVRACAECAPINESLKSTIDLLGQLRDQPPSSPATRR